MTTIADTVVTVDEQRALVLRCRDEHARMDEARARMDVETILDARARIGEATAQWWRLERERKP